MKMVRVLSILKANKTHVNNISQLTIRFMATATAKAKTTTINRSLSTSTGDQIQNKDSSAPSFGYYNCKNPCLDIFFNVVKPSEYIDVEFEKKRKKSDIKADVVACCRYLKELLPVAWSYNPLTTLKLICHLTDEKYYEEAFETAAHWLHHNHPKTLLCNIPSIAKSVGFFHHPVDILSNILEGQDWKRGAKISEKSLTRKAIAMYERDRDYKLLHDRVLDLYVEQLKFDTENFKKQSLKKQYDINYGRSDDDADDDEDDEYCSDLEISDAADCFFWSNSMNARAVTTTLLRESIARKFFPRESYPEYQGVEEANYANRVQDRLRKEVLVPLEKAYRCQGTKYREKACAVETYLKEVKANNSKIAAAACLPHEIIRYVGHSNVGKVAELQWKRMVEEIYLKEGKFRNCLAVCCPDMTRPEEVPLALALLVSELSEEPWKGKLIDCSDSPELHLIPGDDLRHRCEFVRKMHIDCWTDIKKVFDLILDVAVNENLKPEQMIKKVFLFTNNYVVREDYPYDYCCSKTDYEAIQSKYKETGYGNVVPHVVYWNLSDSIEDERPPMPYTQPGVTIVHGLSKSLPKMFLESNGDIGPDHVMEAAISGEKYQKLIVVD